MTVHGLRLLPLSAFAVILLAGCGGPPGDRDAPPRITRLGDDLLGTGGEVRVADSVIGDVMLSGGDLAFSGAAGGSYLGAGGNQEIGGRITESIRAAGGNVVVSAEVGRNVTLAGGNVLLDSAATITHNVYLAGGTVRMRGQVGNALTAFGGEVVVDGTVGGDARISGGQLRIGPNARITGALRHSIPAGKVTIDSGARIAGGVVALPATDGRGLGRLLRTIWILGFLIAGAVIVALLPGFAAATAASVQDRAGASAAFGVAWLFGMPLVILIAAITVVGLPLAALLTAAYLILLYLGRAVVAVWLGEIILRRWRPTARVAPVWSFLVGAVLLLLIGIIPVIGTFLGFVVAVFGAGAVLVTVWPRRQPNQLSP